MWGRAGNWRLMNWGLVIGEAGDGSSAGLIFELRITISQSAIVFRFRRCRRSRRYSWRVAALSLSRNWWWNLLKDNELEIEGGGLFFKPFNALLSELLFVMFDTFFDVLVSVAQHAINQPGKMMGHSNDGLGSTESGSQAAILGSQRAFAVGEALSTEPKAVSSSVVDLAGCST